MRAVALHLGLLALLLGLHFVLPAYHHGNLARVMVLAAFAMGYNILFGYTGLLSLGHALFFAAGMYGTGLAVQHLGWGAGPALAGGRRGGGRGVGRARAAGAAHQRRGLHDRHADVRAGRGADDPAFFRNHRRRRGVRVPQAGRMLAGLDLSDAGTRYLAALVLFAVCLGLCLWLVRTPFGRVLIAIRENEERARMLGYDPFAHKFAAMVISGTMAAAAGAAYGVLFGYVGATFAEVQYSILPLLYVLLGGAGTVLGPFIGTLFMFYLIDLSSDITTAHMLIAGVALVLLTLFAPQGIMGEVRRRLWKGLP